MTNIINISDIQKILSEFAKVRDWEKFHSPKNLSMAIAGEAGELLELFQWLTEQESFQVKKNPKIKEQISYELADIMLYIIRIAEQLSIDLNQALYDKIEINNSKYPKEKVKGSSKKYTEY